ncbi:dicarboxylate/amino acid:cation symporter [Aneurinibacillus sp. REN35]|uniref:dicarboxylate/amino acid:cation symporter n=1 Tax=Aneurinibacillus sp. REN35 TaxID=3237286 RepID=UPI003528078B
MVYISLAIAALLLVLLYYLAKKKVSFGNRVMLAMLLGVGLGAIFGPDAESVGVIGQIYVSLIKMVVMPLVILSIVSSVTKLSDPGQLKKIGIKTVSLFLATTAIAATIGLGVALVMDPGAGIQFTKDASFEAREIPAFKDVLLDLVPSNPINEMAEGKVVPVIIFTTFVAVALAVEGARKPEAIKPVKDFINGAMIIMFRVIKMVIKLTPYGVFGLMTAVAAKYGLAALLPLGKVIIAVYIACILHMVLTYGGLLAFVARVNPLRFFKKIYPVMVVAFTTRSSYATLPVNLEVIKKRVKVSDKIASFVAPLGATINMNGCGGLYPAIVAIFVARVFGIELGIMDYILLIATATVASVGVAGVPGPASISTTVVLTTMGLPLEGMAIVLGVDAIIDMARTTVNATGTTVSSLIIANSEGEFDREAFNRDDKEDELELHAI